MIVVEVRVFLGAMKISLEVYCSSLELVRLLIEFKRLL
jgi:hypothetical protein